MARWEVQNIAIYITSTASSFHKAHCVFCVHCGSSLLTLGEELEYLAEDGIERPDTMGSFEGKQRRKSGYYTAAAFFVITILILKGPQMLFHAICLPDNNAVAFLGWLPEVGNLMNVGVYSSSPGLWSFKLSGIQLHKLVDVSSGLGSVISYMIATAHFIIFGYWIGWRWPVYFRARKRLIKSTLARYGLFFMLNIVIGLPVAIFGLS